MMKNKWILIGLIIIVIIIAIWAIINFGMPLKSSTEPEATVVPVAVPNAKQNDTVNLPNKFFTVDNQGIINLYDTYSKKLADTLNLNLITQTSSTLVNAPINIISINGASVQDEEKCDIETEKTDANSPETNENIDNKSESSTEILTDDIVITPIKDTDDRYYKGFEKVKVKIQSGDTAWGIQRKLTSDKDLVKIMKLVKEVNEGRLLHPIYPGEILVFLKTINSPSSEEPILTPAPIPEPITPSVSVDNGTDEFTPPYLYSTSKDHKVLYAYLKNRKTFYIVSANDYKFEVKTLLTCSNMPSFMEFKVTEDNIFALSIDKTSIIKLPINAQTAPILYHFEAPIDVWEASNNYLYYCHGEALEQLNLLTNKNYTTQLGDISEDIFLLNNKLYVLNQFGSGLENAILIKMNSSNLLVEGLVELKNKNNIVFQNVNNNIIYIGQEADTTSNVISIPTESFEINEETFVLTYKTKPINIQNFIFKLENNNAIICDTTGKFLWEIPVSGENIIVLE